MKKILTGIILGMSYVIPGICSASMALTLGCFEDMIEIFEGFYQIKILKKHFWFIFGIIIGIIGYVFLFNWLYEKFPHLILGLFLGMIINGFPIKKDEFVKEEKINTHIGYKIIRVILFITGFIVITVINFVGNNYPIISIENGLIGYYFYVFFTAIIASLALILPGISGALLLVTFGIYVPLLKSVETIIIINLFNFHLLIDENLMLVILFLMGFILGILLFSKIIVIFMKKYPRAFFSLTNGFMLASILTMVYSVIEIFNKTGFDLFKCFSTMIFIIFGYFFIKYFERFVIRKKAI